MPILPLHQPDALSTILGRMVYPSESEIESRKAAMLTLALMEGPLNEFDSSGDEILAAKIFNLVTAGGAVPDDFRERYLQGITAGGVFRWYVALAHEMPEHTTWKNANYLWVREGRDINKVSARNRIKGANESWARLPLTETYLIRARRRFKTVIHLWAAWMGWLARIQDPEHENPEAPVAFDWFLRDVEALRIWGQCWSAPAKWGKPPIPEDCWRLPDDWMPVLSNPGWPDQVPVPAMGLPDDFVPGPGRGRPKGSSKK